MKFILLLITVFLSGCMEGAVKEYDPKEVVVRGRVVAKQQAEKQDVERELAQIRRAEMMGTLVQNLATLGVGVVVLPIGVSTEVPGKPTQYEVDMENGNRVRLYSGHSGFQEGDCVAVFLSEDWEKFPPRMAYAQEVCRDVESRDRP